MSTTAFEKKKVITYAATGNEAICKFYMVQPIFSTLYRTETRNTHGSAGPYYGLCIFFPNIPVGLMFQDCVDADKELDESIVMRSLKQNGLDSPDHFIEHLDQRAVNGAFIGNAQIEMARYIAPERVETYQKARESFYEKRQLEEEAKAKQQIEKEAALKTEREAALEAERAKLLGFGDGMSPVKLGKTLSILEKRFRYDGVIKTRLQFIIDALEEGYRPNQIENHVTYYGSRWEPKESKPKTLYRLTKGSVGYDVTKTEYDFAMYLVQKNESVSLFPNKAPVVSAAKG